jgi:hypothetical protein
MTLKLRNVGALLGIVLFAVSACFLLLARGGSADQRLAESVKASHEVYTTYLGDDYDAAKQAILGHVEYLDKLSGESNNPVRNPFAVDSVAWVVRLSKLEERYNRGGEGEYIREAVARCEKLGDGRDRSADRLRQEVDLKDSVAVTGAKTEK